MLALKGLLFSVIVLILTTLVSLLVVGLIRIVYKMIHKTPSAAKATK